MLTGTQISIPPKNRSEWSQLVTGQIIYKFKNYVLQRKTAEYASKITNGQMTVGQAVDEFYDLCNKYALAVQIDFKEIFKTW